LKGVAVQGPDEEGIACLWMRGGTSKGAYLLASDLPADRRARDGVLLGIMGSPDPRQIDGIGGADPLTSKVAVLAPSSRADADVDYLFLQVLVDQARVTDAQGCGNILAGVGPAAIERGLVPARDGETAVRIHMVNTGEVALARVATPGGRVSYAGGAAIDGVPGRHAAVPLMFQGIAGSMCGALLPTGRVVDVIDGVECTLIDNGMPCVVMDAAGFGLSGQEGRAVLDADTGLKARIEAIRLQAGPRMNLGDVAAQTVPKMTLVSPPARGGAIGTRSFIPHRCHATIGVFAAVSVATACTLPGSPAARLAVAPPDGCWRIEHPEGAAEVLLEVDAEGRVTAAGTLRTARKLFDGRVFPAPWPATAPEGPAPVPDGPA
jgi:4-oxalomesaconate tautomerase